MEEVLKQLYEIESAASTVKSTADDKKKKMEAAMNKKIQEFDARTDEETAKTLKEQKEKLNAEIAKELKDQREHVNHVLTALDAEYEQHHTKLANQILETLIKE